MMMPPIGPQYEPEQVRAVNTHDIVQRQQPATPATWVVGILLVIVALAWITLLVTGSHHTSVMPEATPAAARSAIPAR
ncbi:MAG: hypothetical protein M3169_15415 [Candidatus Eremiobacteraeota bacterium]|nr:hypothetical protein [Candidatus Eremiobacteraeota bacterium]